VTDRNRLSTGPANEEPPIEVTAIARLAGVDRAGWDALDHGPSPFLRHGFLQALEDSGSVGGRSGWTPVYLLARRGDRLVGGAAGFIKTHSYGEYIFDFGWAQAAARARVPYYPKLVFAAPMTPATGRRLLLAPDLDEPGRAKVIAALVAGARAVAEQAECYSIHWLFCTAEEQAALAALGFAPRASFQFHWRRDPAWQAWPDFVGAMTSRKRKQLNKERTRVGAAVAPVEWRTAGELEPGCLDDLDRWYRSTTEEHGGTDYLRPGFFHRLAETLPEPMRVAVAHQGGQRIAGALFFETDAALYGRYWGADARVEFLHFEVAYYAAIDRCLARGTPLFEAGAQGEHKLLRGFLPCPTYSAHWLRHPGLSAAIDDFCAREAGGVAHTMAELAAAGPFRKGSDDS
jgi:hypothetical protein